jgi:hypothetical protein
MKNELKKSNYKKETSAGKRLKEPLHKEARLVAKSSKKILKDIEKLEE